VGDSNGLEPPERGLHRVGAAPLTGVNERREPERPDARVNTPEVTRRESCLIAAEAEAARAGPRAPLMLIEDTVGGLGPPLPDGVVENDDPAAAPALVGGEDLLDGIPDRIPRKADPFDHRGRHVDLGVTDSLAAEAADEVAGDRAVIAGSREATADVAVEGEEGPEVTAEETPRADGRKIGENRAGPAPGEPDEGRGRDGPLEVQVEFDLRGGTEATEEASGQGAPSYGVLPPGIPPVERLWLRVAAYGVDLVILAGVPLLVSTLAIVGILLSIDNPPASLGGGFFAAQVVFGILFLVRDVGGQSPGKRLFGLRLVREEGRPVGFFASITRNLPMLIPGWNLLELLAVIRRADGRRGGDRLAGTTLVEP
jgi:uncharacterized RDD family membrane protein YckC